MSTITDIEKSRQVQSAKAAYAAAYAKNDYAGMAAAHAQAEAARSPYGYTGGVDGGNYSDTKTGQSYGTAAENGVNTSSNNGYVPIGTYFDAGVSDSDKASITNLQNQWQAAHASGNKTLEAQLHAQAEAIRAKYNYSGNVDGSDYLANGTTRFPKGTTEGANAQQLPSATSQEDYINSMYSAAQEKALAALKTAYDNNTATVDAQAAKIPGIYHASENAVAADNAQQTQNMNEYFAANGLNNGAAGQAQLSQNNVYQKNIGSLEEAKATALNDVETQRTQISTQYQNAIAEAIANNNYEQAKALYDEAVRVDESIVSTALNQAQLNYQYATLNQNQAQFNTSNQISAADNLAQYGDFSGYKSLGYTGSQIANMTAAYKAAAAAAAAKKSGSGGSGAPRKTGNSNFSAIDAYVNSLPTITSTMPTALHSGMAKNLWALIKDPTRKNATLSDGSTLIQTRIAQAFQSGAITEDEANYLTSLYEQM